MFLKMLKLFAIFFKIGLFTFGGGYAMIPMISQDLLHNNYLSQAQITQFIGISEATPGPFAINIATFAGFHVFEGEALYIKLLGSFFATLGVFLPSFIIILIIAILSDKLIKTKPVQNALKVIQPMVLGFILAAFLSVALMAILGNFKVELSFDYIALIIFVVVLIIGLKFKKISPVYLILISAFLGILLYQFI